MRADLHLHTDYSDGTEPPSAVVEQAAAAGLALIAVADHDSLGALVEARAACERQGVRLVPAVEFTAALDGGEIHLLGYFRELPGGEVAAHLKNVQEFRRQRLDNAIHELRKWGLSLSVDELPCSPHCESLTSAHLAQLLVRKGYATSLSVARRRYLRGKVLLPFEVTAEEVIRLIRSAGGIAVWAHPGRRRFRGRLEQLAALGLDGVEVVNFSRGQDSAGHWQRELYKMGLVTTGGSDWHGRPRCLGELTVDEELIGEFLRRLQVV